MTAVGGAPPAAARSMIRTPIEGNVMARIAVIGGTGYAGSHIVTEAVRRGHTVVSVARTVPNERVEGATYIEGTLLDVPSLVAELQGVDVVVSTVPGRGSAEGRMW